MGLILVVLNWYSKDLAKDWPYQIGQKFFIQKKKRKPWFLGAKQNSRSTLLCVTNMLFTAPE